MIGRNAERTGSSPADFGTNDECTIAVSPERDMTSCDPSECKLGDLYGSLCHPHPSNKAPKLPSVQHHNFPHSTLFQAMHITHPCADNLFIWKKNSEKAMYLRHVAFFSSLVSIWQNGPHHLEGGELVDAAATALTFPSYRVL